MRGQPAADGPRLACRLAGAGEPLIRLPDGPMQFTAYLGDLGGLSAHRSLVKLDVRGTSQVQSVLSPGRLWLE